MYLKLLFILFMVYTILNAQNDPLLQNQLSGQIPKYNSGKFQNSNHK